MRNHRFDVIAAYYAFINGYELDNNFWGMKKLQQLDSLGSYFPARKRLYTRFSNSTYNDLKPEAKKVYHRLESKLTKILNTGTVF